MVSASAQGLWAPQIHQHTRSSCCMGTLISKPRHGTAHLQCKYPHRQTRRMLHRYILPSNPLDPLVASDKRPYESSRALLDVLKLFSPRSSAKDQAWRRALWLQGTALARQVGCAPSPASPCTVSASTMRRSSKTGSEIHRHHHGRGAPRDAITQSGQMGSKHLPHGLLALQGRLILKIVKQQRLQIPVPGRGVKDPPCVFQHVVTGHAELYRVDLEELLLRACAPWSLGVGAIEASHHQSLLPCCATKTSGLFFGGENLSQTTMYCVHLYSTQIPKWPQHTWVCRKNNLHSHCCSAVPGTKRMLREETSQNQSLLKAQNPYWPKQENLGWPKFEMPQVHWSIGKVSQPVSHGLPTIYFPKSSPPDEHLTPWWDVQIPWPLVNGLNLGQISTVSLLGHDKQHKSSHQWCIKNNWELMDNC